jgi:ribosomal protein L32
MADEPAKIILGDTLISALEQPPRAHRRLFGKRKKEAPPLTHCENCGAQLHGRWCAQCGQPAIDYRRSFRHVIIDVLDSFLNWDSKFFATIAWLIVRPWHLTIEFLSGHRIRYLHPLRLYLLASILFFFAVNYWAKSIHLDSSKMSPKDRANIQAELKKEDLPPNVRAKIEKSLKLASPPPEAATKTEESPKGEETPHQTQGKAEEKEQNKPKDQDFGPLLQLGPESPSNSFEKWMQARAKEKIGEHGTNAQLFLITVISNLPYMMLCCIPLFAFVLKILYIRRHIFYIDHLVYALHIHTFAYVGIILIGLITMALHRGAPASLTGWIIAILWLAFATQIFLSIRRIYRQGWFFSILKFFVGGFVYLFVLGMALVATFLITLALP